MEELMRRYRRSDKLYLICASAALIFGALIPSGIIGMLMLLLSREYLKLAEESV